MVVIHSADIHLNVSILKKESLSRYLGASYRSLKSESRIIISTWALVWQCLVTMLLSLSQIFQYQKSRLRTISVTSTNIKTFIFEHVLLKKTFRVSNFLFIQNVLYPWQFIPTKNSKKNYGLGRILTYNAGEAEILLVRNMIELWGKVVLF